MSAEHLFDAIGQIGADLVDSAAHTVPAVSPWRRWVATAAVMALLIVGAAMALPRLGTPDPAPDPLQTGRVAPIRTTMVLDGKIYYVDDDGELPDQTQLQSAIAGEPLEILPEHTGSSVLDQAVIYPTNDAEQMILQLKDELHTARTYGEFYGMEFGYEMASASSHETLFQVFVEPIENYFTFGLRFANPSELNEPALVMFFWAMLQARDAAGIRALEIEERQTVGTNGEWSYSAQEIRRILDQYLTGHSFTLTTGTFGILAMEPTAPIYPVLREAVFDDAARRMVLQVDVYADPSHKTLLRESTYTIQFTGSTYRYLSILDRRPDQPSGGTTAPKKPAD